MIVPARRFLAAALLLLVALTLCAQEEENLDDLFSDPVADVVVEAVVTDHLRQYVTRDAITLSGSFSAEGGAIAGWSRFPVIDDLAEGFDGTVGLISTVTLNFDARPDPDFRLFGTVSTSIDPINGQYTWPAFVLGELFVDYTWLGDVFFRMGRHSITWGQGRLFESITNIMADAGSGFALRANLPTLLDGVSLITLIQDGYFMTPLKASYREFCYAVKADKVVWNTLISAGARYQDVEGFNALLSMKRVVAGIDILADVRIHRDVTTTYQQVLAGFFKQWDDFILYGEYYWNGQTAGGLDHSMGLACGFNNILQTPVDLGIKWFHAFSDGSGTVTAGITWVPWKLITATVGLPVVYGDDGTRYVAANADPAGRRIALAFGLEMAVSF